MKKIKLIIADDHILLRDALASLINSFGEFEVIAKATNGKEVLHQLELGNIPDLLILDLNMPEMNGFDTAKTLAQKYPQVTIVILTMYDSEVTLIKLLQFGVKGFLKKDIDPYELKKALLQVSESQYYYSSGNINKLTEIISKGNQKDNSFPKNTLSDLELEFLRLSCSELTYKEIANSMNLTPRKVDHIRDNLFEKLDMKSRVGLAMFAIKNGLITL